MLLTPLTQIFPRPKIRDLRAAVHFELGQEFLTENLSGQRIALLLSSRGIANYAQIVGAVGEYFRSRGMEVYGVPAMGSHAGATPEGQLGILAKCGITPATMGFPIHAEMDTVQVGEVMGGTPVHVARRALEADRIFAINRVKPHTQIVDEALGSGITKMYAIGIGKLNGPDGYHKLVTADRTLGEVVRAVASVVIDNPKVLGGLGIAENAHHETAYVNAFRRENLFANEAKLFAIACEYMPSLPLMEIGVLVIGRIGKMLSGSGMDPNITGRWWPGKPRRAGDPAVKHIAVMDRLGNNFLGVGFADSCNTRVFTGVDPSESILNARTGGRPQLAVPPSAQATCDRELFERALADAGTDLPLVYIRDTLTCHRMYVSTHGHRVLREHAQVTFGEPVEVRFDEAGNIAAPTFEETDH